MEDRRGGQVVAARQAGVWEPVPRGRQRLRWAIAAAILVTCWCRVSLAQVIPWEYAPYKIEAWVEFAPAPELTPRFVKETHRRIEQVAELEVGAPWMLRAVSPEPETRAELQAWLITAADLKLKAIPRPGKDVQNALENDKLLFVEIVPTDGGFRIKARELDCRTRIWGESVERTVAHEGEIAYAVISAGSEAFVPVARIESVQDKQAVARLRAGGLLLDRPSPARVADGAVLRPIVRRNDRYGEPRPGGIMVAPWTYLRVTAQAGPLLTCEVSSGVRGAIGSRSNQRTERLALLVRPRGDSTRLVLQSKGASPVPLVGYEIYEPGDSEERSKLLGVTDWRGALDIGKGEGPLRTVIVKNGGQLLARLPLVPGLSPEERAELPDDQKRLEAESAVRGLNASLLDVVARREVLAVRIRRKIAAQEFAGAQTLIDELRVLDSRTNLSERLDQFQRDYISPDKKVQGKIDQLFSDTRALLNKHLNMRLADQLSGELTKAKTGGG